MTSMSALMNKEIENAQKGGTSYLFGTEIGTAQKVRAKRSFRMFYKTIEKAKSGKAVLVELTVFVKHENTEIAKIEGLTYLPNFVLESSDVYWILENKVRGGCSEVEYMSIDNKFVPKNLLNGGNTDAYRNTRSPEKIVEDFIKSLQNAKASKEAKK